MKQYGKPDWSILAKIDQSGKVTVLPTSGSDEMDPDSKPCVPSTRICPATGIRAGLASGTPVAAQGTFISGEPNFQFLTGTDRVCSHDDCILTLAGSRMSQGRGIFRCDKFELELAQLMGASRQRSSYSRR